MRDFRPLFFQNLNVRLHQLAVERLQVNRHLRELDRIHQHSHAYYQLILYLGGRGIQVVEGEGYPVRSGTVLWLEPGLKHAFRETQALRPICLVLDLNLKGEGYRPRRLGQLTSEELSEVKQLLSRLMQLKGDDVKIRAAGTVLLVLDILLRKVGWLAPVQSGMTPPVVRRVKTILEDPANQNLTLSEVALKAGYQQDHLNRILKQSVGGSLGHMRDQIRMRRARQFLQQPLQVQDVADRLGFSDQNYFARWFRRQTGQTPTKWRMMVQKEGVQ